MAEKKEKVETQSIPDRIEEKNKKSIAEAEVTVQEEMEIFIPPKYLKTSTGEKISWPKVTWGKEVRVLRLLGDVIDAVPEITEANYEDFNASGIVKIFGAVVQRVPEKISEAVEILIDQDEQWIETNMDSSDIIALLYPFFLERRSLIQKALSDTK